MLKKTSVSTIVVALAMGGVDFAGATEAPLHIRSTGTFISTPIDVNGDKIPASESTLTGYSRRFGPVTAKILTEGKLAFDGNGKPVTCVTPEGSPGIINELVVANGVYRFRGGDLLYTQAKEVNTCTDLQACFDENNNVKKGCKFFGLAKGDIIGGTGRFACASGSIEDTSEGLALVVDSKNQFFGAIKESNVDGTLEFERNCRK